VFLSVCGEQGIKELFARVADDEQALIRAFTELESAFRDNDFKSLAFYAYVATAHADEPIAGNARVGVGEVLLRCGDHEAALNEFQENCLNLYAHPGGPRLEQRVFLGKGRARENLGKMNEAAIDYKMAWQCLPDSELGQAAAERLARIRAEQGRPGEAFAWCLRTKSARPTATFSDKRLNELYSGQMKAVHGQAERLATSLREAIERGGDPAEVLAEKERVATLLAGMGQDPSGETYPERSRAIQARALLGVSVGVLDLLRDPDSIVSKAEDLGRLSAAVYLTEPHQRESALDTGLLKASDSMIESALREALVKNAGDEKNAARLAAAHLYYAATRPDGGRTQLDLLVSSFSKDIKGLNELYSSREVADRTATACKAAGLLGSMQAQSGAFIEQDIGAAESAESLKRLATQALDARRPGLAVAALERIQMKFPNQVDAAELTYLLAEACFQNAEWAKAKESFREYIAMQGKDQARRVEAEYLCAMCDFYAGSYPQAAAGLSAFSQKHPASEWAPMATRVSLDSCARYGDSLHVPPEEKRQALLELANRFAGTPLGAEANFYLGKLLTTNRFRDFPGALKHFTAALEGREGDAAAYHIGLCYQELGELDLAEEWYSKVIRESKSEYPRKWARSGLKMIEEARKRISR
jgi:tetratricopeptide (TPR) repeat protein